MDNKHDDKTRDAAKDAAKTDAAENQPTTSEVNVDKTIKDVDEQALKDARPIDTADRGIPSHPEQHPRTNPDARHPNVFVQHERLDEAAGVQRALDGEEGDEEDGGCAAVNALVAQSQSRGLLIEPGEVMRVAEGCDAALGDELVHVAKQYAARNALMEPGVVATINAKYAENREAVAAGAAEPAVAETGDGKVVSRKKADATAKEKAAARKTDGARKK